MLLLKVRFPQNNLCLSWSSIFRAGSCFVRFYILLYFPSFPLLETENCKICINFHSWDIWQKYKSWSLIYSLKTDVLTRFPELLRMKEETNVQTPFPKSKWMKQWAAETRSSLSKPASDWEKLIGWSRVSGKRITVPLLALGHHHPIPALQDIWISFLLAIIGHHHPYLALRDYQRLFLLTIFGHHHPYFALWDNCKRG